MVERGINVNGIHGVFAHDRRRIDTRTRVYLSQILIGITSQEVKEALEYYGDIDQVNPVTKLLHGHRIDTGDRILIFKGLARYIPLYVFIRGWRAFIKYHSQPQTCRICGLTSHFAKDCPKSQKQAGANKVQPENTPENASKDKPAKKPAEEQPGSSPPSLETHITQEEIIHRAPVILYRKRSLISWSQIQRS